MPKITQFDKQLQQWQLNDSLMLKQSRLLKKIHLRQQKNTLTFKSHEKPKSRPSSSPVKSIQIKTSINQLRHMSHNQQQHSSKIRSRFNYLHTSTQRQKKLVDLAKQKFQKVNQIRRKSFTDKSSLSQQRENILKQHSKTVYLQASRIKTERQKTSESQLKIKEQKHHLALSVKQQRSMNESLIKEQKNQEISMRSQKVLSIQKQQQLQRQKSLSRNKQRVEKGVIDHKKNILAQYQKIQRQLKTNTKLMKNFKEMAEKISDQKIRQDEQLQRYRSFLGMNKNPRNFQKSKHGVDYVVNVKPSPHSKLTEQTSSSKKAHSPYKRGSNGVQKSIYLTVFE